MKIFLTCFVIIIFFVNGVSAVVLPGDDPAGHHRKPDSRDARTKTVSAEMFSLFMAVQGELPSAEVKAYWQDLNEFTALMQEKKAKYKNEKAFLKYLFYKVHRQYLKKYQYQTTLYHLFEDGSYNCVTGTALYAMLLDALDLSYTIQEMPYHVFLIVRTAQATDSLLMESTDPYGFITDHKTMADAIENYRKAPPQEGSSPMFDYGFRIDEHINLQKLAGLNYFNQAVDYYNQQRLEKATQYLREAMILYPAKRMDAFQSLIYQTNRRADISH